MGYVQVPFSRNTRVVEETFTNRLQIDHFELLYYENRHYDAIMSQETGIVSDSCPILTGRVEKKTVDLTTTNTTDNIK